MTDIPQRLFEKAQTYGLECIADANGNHRIKPAIAPHWELACHKGRWVLTINGVPQMHFQYDDVFKFLDRVAHPASVLADAATRPSASV